MKKNRSNIIAKNMKKRLLYENIIHKVSHIIKNTLNEELGVDDPDISDVSDEDIDDTGVNETEAEDNEELFQEADDEMQSYDTESDKEFEKIVQDYDPSLIYKIKDNVIYIDVDKAMAWGGGEIFNSENNDVFQEYIENKKQEEEVLGFELQGDDLKEFIDFCLDPEQILKDCEGTYSDPELQVFEDNKLLIAITPEDLDELNEDDIEQIGANIHFDFLSDHAKNELWNSLVNDPWATPIENFGGGSLVFYGEDGELKNLEEDM